MKSHPMGAFFPRVAGIVQIWDKDFKPPWQKFSFEKKRKEKEGEGKRNFPPFVVPHFLPPHPVSGPA